VTELGLVNPSDDAVLVDENAGGKRDVASIPSFMADVQATNESALLVAEKREVRAELLTEAMRDLRRIHADRKDANTDPLDLLLEAAELTQLTGTERSPIASIEKVESRVSAVQGLRIEDVALGIRQTEVGESLAGRETDLAPREARTVAEIHENGDEACELDCEEDDAQRRRVLEHCGETEQQCTADENELLVRIAPEIAAP
jgi:hypothetical protein